MKRISYIFLFIFFFSSCETIVEIDVPPVDEQISIHCLLSDEDIFGFTHLGTVEQITNGNSPIFIDNASIKLLNKNSNEEVLFNSFPNDEYYLSVIDEMGDNANDILELDVKHPIYGDYKVSQILPEKPIINSFSYEEINAYSSLQGTRYNTLEFDFNDDGATQDFYHVQAFIRNQCCENDYYSIWTWSLNPLLEETVAAQGLIFSDKSFNGNNLSLELNVENTYIDPSQHFIYLRFSRITEDYYLHLKSQKNYEDAEFNPFAEPVTLHSNVDGAFGIFAVEATTYEFIQ